MKKTFVLLVAMLTLLSQPSMGAEAPRDTWALLHKELLL